MDMEKRKTFCEVCRKDTEFTILEKKMDGVIKGEVYTYIGMEPHCAECGSEVYDGEVNDFNLKALYEEYRKKNGIVSLDLVLAIPEKYAIGKRPLSLLLGWGEHTFSRYCDGDMPTKQYSDILEKIYNEPHYYAEILEKNKGNLKTEASYGKSKRAVDMLLGNTVAAEEKIDLVIGYLLNKCEDITPLALQKALYYIQGFYFAFYKTFLFSEECEAWVHGPVYRDIYFRYRDYHFDPIKTNVGFDDAVFSSSEKAVLDSVIKNICCYSGKILEKFTHAESPWLLTRAELPEHVTSNRMIPKEQIADYFVSVKEKYHMLTPNDIKEYSRIMFETI